MKFNAIGELLDLIFSLFGKYGRWQNNQGRKICFLVWGICSFYWAARDFQCNLWTQGIFCLVSVVLHAHGYWNWSKKGIGEKKDVSVSIQ